MLQSRTYAYVHHLPCIDTDRTDIKVQQDKKGSQSCGAVTDLALEDQLEGERAFAGEVGVALRVVDACLQHPSLVQHGEARRLVVQPRDEVVSAVRPELHLYS